MKFWDTSAVVPLLLDEPATGPVRDAYRNDSVVVVAWTTVVECSSALARSEREGDLGQTEATTAFSRLDELARVWHEVEPSNDVRDLARRLLRVHTLRTGDAIQLASATLAAERRPASLTIVTLNDRLETAAQKEGFPVLVPGRSHPGSDSAG